MWQKPRLFFIMISVKIMQFLSLGVILKTRGLKGEVKVKSTTDFASIRYKKNSKVYLYDENTEQFVEAHVRSYTSSQGFDYLSFVEFPSIEAISPFVKRKIVVDKEEQKPLGKDTYYFCDLVGCEVFDSKRGRIGKVVRVESYASYETLRVETEGKDLLLPFVKAFVKEIDISDKKIVCELIEGMI